MRKSIVKRRWSCVAVLCGIAANALAVDAAHHGGDHMMGAQHYGKFLLDKFEGGDDDTAHWDAQAWYGGDLNRLWLKAAGERAGGTTEHAEAQALYSRAISPFFDAQVGARHDFRPESSRDWLALGIQGLAPYFFETEATLFVGSAGRTALRLKVEYDLLLTQRLILAPEVETNLYGEDDPDAGIGGGLADLAVGLRLRYEIRREFAPYFGVVWSNRYGETADLARAHGDTVRQTRWVAGIRLWF